MYPTKADFDNATAEPWAPATCLLIQCGKRHGLKTTVNTPFTQAFRHMDRLREEFDAVFAARQPDKAKLKAFRAKLPTRD